MYSVSSNVDELEPSCKFAKLAVLGIGVQIGVLGHPIDSSVPCIGGLKMFLTAKFSLSLFFPFSPYFPVSR